MTQMTRSVFVRSANKSERRQYKNRRTEEMKLSDLSVFSVKRKVRNAIWKSQDAIEKCEADLQAAQYSLAKMQGVPGVEKRVVRNMESAVRSMDTTLADLKSSHSRFVSEQKQPSAAFPRGISV